MAGASWPTLRCTGFVRGRTAKESTALLNEKAYRVGEQVEGVTIKDVRTDAVVLEYGGQTRLIHKNETLTP